MGNKIVAYNSGAASPHGSKSGNHEIASANNDYRNNASGLTWYNSPSYGNDYLLVSNTYDLGLTTQGNAKPLFWVASNDAEFLNIVNRLSIRRGLADLATVQDAITWINSNGKYSLINQPTTVPTSEFYYDPGNPLSYDGSSTNLVNIGSLGKVGGAGGALSGVAYDNKTAGGVFNFDGVADRISFGQHDFGNVITVASWVYPRTENSINCLMSNCGANTATNGFKMGWNNWTTTNLTMNFEAGNGTAGGTTSTASNTIVENQWQHIAFLFDKVNRTIEFYRNGAKVGKTGTPIDSVGMNQTWWIGAIGGNSYYMNANVGEFKIWKSLLSASDLSSEYNLTKSRYGL